VSWPPTPPTPCVTVRVTLRRVICGADQGLPSLSSSPRCAGSYPTVPKGRGSPSRSALRGLTIHPAARRVMWIRPRRIPFPPENAVDDASSSTLQPIRHCANADCTKLLDSARSIYCSAACKQRCYRARHTTPRLAKVDPHAPERVRTDRVAHSVYECSSCSERFVGVSRCPDCHLFMRNVGVGGACLHCDEPLLLTELLGNGGVTLLT
jgi:hypothetical protein